MPDRDDALTRLSEAVADGTAVDWDRMAALAAGDEAVVEQLRIIATISNLHRTSEVSPSPSAPPGYPEPDVPSDARRWGSLFILNEIGDGSFGRVYRALDPRLHREVALKVLRHADAPGASAHLVAEARLLARVRHPNIVIVHGADVVEGETGLWMELVHGRTLSSLVMDQGPFGAAEAVMIGATLCHALAAVHQAGLLHRDIKAQNVMREAGGRIVLMDFGAGRDLLDAHAGSKTVGTPVYLAPEVLAGGPASVQSDIYSLGVLLFHLTTGRYPANAATVADLRAVHDRGESASLRDARPDLPPEFVEVVTRALHREPAARYESAGRFEQALLRTVAAPTDVVPAKVPVPIPSTPSRRVGIVLAIVAALAIALVVGWPRIGRLTTSETPSVAVLPLRNLSGDASKQYLADSLTDVLITHLTKIKGLRVLSYASVASLDPKGAPADLSKTLGVRYLLAGAVAIDGGMIRTTLQLVDGGNGGTVWSDEFTRDRSGLLGQQAEIARTVAARLKVDLTPDTSSRLALRRPVSGDAQDLFLRGQMANEGAIADFVGSVHYLERAVATDPEFADAWAALSLARVRMTNQVHPADRDAQYERARTEALKALELDPLLPATHKALANFRFYRDWDWDGAETAFAKAIELAPGDWTTYWQYSILLAAEARFDDAIRMARQAVGLDPMSWRPALNLGTIFYYARRYDDAVRETRRVLELSPGLSIAHYQLCKIATAANRLDEAVSECQASVEKGDRTNGLLGLARVHALTGRRQQAEETLATVEQSARASLTPDRFAFVRMALGERDRAFSLLEQGLAVKAGNLIWIRVDPAFDQFRSDARFPSLVQRITRGHRQP